MCAKVMQFLLFAKYLLEFLLKVGSEDAFAYVGFDVADAPKASSILLSSRPNLTIIDGLVHKH